MSKRTTDFLEELKTLLFKYDAEICTHDNTMIDVLYTSPVTTFRAPLLSFLMEY